MSRSRTSSEPKKGANRAGNERNSGGRPKRSVVGSTVKGRERVGEKGGLIRREGGSQPVSPAQKARRDGSKATRGKYSAR